MNYNKTKVVWPVKYAKCPNIWMAWEVVRNGNRNAYISSYRSDQPIGQLIITRDNINFFTANKFQDGYKYFWIDCESKDWSEMTREDFNNAKSYYRYHRAPSGYLVYKVNLAYSAITPPDPPKSTYAEYKAYLNHYYPDYGGEYCSVYALWSPDDLPLMQIQKTVNIVDSKVEWYYACPGDKEYTPLYYQTTWLALSSFVRARVMKLTQVHPAEYFGFCFQYSEHLGFHFPEIDPTQHSGGIHIPVKSSSAHIIYHDPEDLSDIKRPSLLDGWFGRYNDAW